MSKCATIGCAAEPAERISYTYRSDGDRSTDDVCSPCADSYAAHPVLTEFQRDSLPLIQAAEFFYANAGYSYPTGSTEAEQDAAHWEAARELATAEALAKSAGAWTYWEPDSNWSVPGEESLVATLCAYGQDGETVRTLASVGGVDYAPHGSDARRVFEAELAVEARGELEPAEEPEAEAGQ